MQFSVIFSVDVPQGISIKDFAPPQVGRLWTRTEGDEQYEYSYLEGRWEKGRHRKWTALLTRRQFDAFVSKLGLYAEDVQTMGSLDGFGWAPAISFNGDHEDAFLSAYITPIPETSKEGGDERNWKRVRRAVLSEYGGSRLQAVA
jgi:hypothetical protein